MQPGSEAAGRDGCHELHLEQPHRHILIVSCFQVKKVPHTKARLICMFPEGKKNQSLQC